MYSNWQSRGLRVKCQMDGKLPLDEKSLRFAVLSPHSAATKDFTLFLWHSCAAIKRGGEDSMKAMNTKSIVFVGVFVALSIVLTRFLSFQLPFLRISFGFLPIALSAILFGPLTGGITGALADVIGFAVAGQGNFFPGFTLSAFLAGAIYGFFLHRKQKNIVSITAAVVIITVFIDMLLNTLWISILLKKAFMAYLPLRALKAVLWLPVQVIAIKLVWQYTKQYFEKMFDAELY